MKNMGGKNIKYKSSSVIKLSSKKKLRKEKLEEIEFINAANKQIEKNKNGKHI